VQAKFLHTLGNLTLTGYNSEYSDHPFAFKRDTVTDRVGNPIGLAHSPLKLNRGLAKVPVWDEAAIQFRANRLATEAAEVWQAPILHPDVLAAYRPGKQGTQYAIDDHPYLVGGAMAALFQDLRQRILGIDPCVSEEFLKLYVAFKAETNFVDVVPQARRLRLSLNLGFHEIDDPRDLCIDVSNLGRWGNGDVEVGLSSVDQLPYVMGLIRQAFDHQMGNQGDN
jgi:predicted transport protein